MAHILVLNAGSSSLKFGLFTAEKAPQPLATGLVERIGGPAHMRLRSHDGGVLYDAAVPAAQAADHAGALAAAFQHVGQHFAQAHIVAVGHRIVHGGRDFVAPVVLGASEMQALAALVPFAPLHQPHNLAGVRAAMALLPDAVQIGCFDTAFHRHHPFVNDTFALPRDYYEKGVRRYGFHGLSYAALCRRLPEISTQPLPQRLLALHLGNGASICAIKDGQSVGTTMGYSPLEGLTMGTRVGTLL